MSDTTRATTSASMRSVNKTVSRLEMALEFQDPRAAEIIAKGFGSSLPGSVGVFYVKAAEAVVQAIESIDPQKGVMDYKKRARAFRAINDIYLSLKS